MTAVDSVKLTGRDRHERLLTATEAGEILGRSPAWMADRRSPHNIPRRYLGRPGTKGLRFRLGDVLAYAKSLAAS